MATSGQRLDLHEDFGHTVADILVIDKFGMARRGSNRSPHLADKLLARLVHAHHRVVWRVRTVIPSSTSSMAATNPASPSGGIFQYLRR
jgi:hypothetical protein